MKTTLLNISSYLNGDIMKNALLIALTLVSVSAFAKPTKEQRHAAHVACKAEVKNKSEMKACVKGKLAAPATAEAAK
jgi:hypothetical protein